MEENYNLSLNIRREQLHTLSYNRRIQLSLKELSLRMDTTIDEQNDQLFIGKDGNVCIKCHGTISTLPINFTVLAMQRQNIQPFLFYLKLLYCPQLHNLPLEATFVSFQIPLYLVISLLLTFLIGQMRIDSIQTCLHSWDSP